MSDLRNDEAVYRTAPATPGLLTTYEKFMGQGTVCDIMLPLG